MTRRRYWPAFLLEAEKTAPEVPERARYMPTDNTHRGDETVTLDVIEEGEPVSPLVEKYDRLQSKRRLGVKEHLKLSLPLGEGGQGVVYLGERLGTDNFQLPIALKFFSPDPFRNIKEYNEVMSYSALVAAAVAQIQHDNLLDVRSWFQIDGIRVMEMEFVDGVNLYHLMQNSMLDWMKRNLSAEEYADRTRVVVTRGVRHPRLKTGIALTVIRECLNALTALHDCGIVHGDIKPANIMLKKTGAAKIIDLGAAFFYKGTPPSCSSCVCRRLT